MIHRAIISTMERFFGLLIEHYAGDFPLWLAPVQVALVPMQSVTTTMANRWSSIEGRGAAGGSWTAATRR